MTTSTNLWSIEQKLRGIAYLIEQLGSDPTPPVPDEMELINKGIGLVLFDIANEFRDARYEIEGGSGSEIQDQEDNHPKESKDVGDSSEPTGKGTAEKAAPPEDD